MSVELNVIFNSEYNLVLAKYDINTPLRRSHFWAQCSHETNHFSQFSENLNYSVQGLLSTFGRHRITRAQCYSFGRVAGRSANKVSIANAIYGGEFGRINLGNTEVGDGSKYIGRGLLQCTGRANYTKFNSYYKERYNVDLDLVNHPELMSDMIVGLVFACWYWTNNNLNALADLNKIVTITRKINGGTKGLDDRVRLQSKYLKLLKS